MDFERLRKSKAIKLFLAATNVETGKARIFTNEEITSDVVMASSCLPFLFQAVEIEGQHYWDGGYMGNPVLYPLFYHTDARDVIILHINPIFRPGVPRTAPEIENRLNEITFNASLIKEIRAIAFVQKMLEDGWLKPEFAGKLKNVLMHSMRADKALADLGVPSKFSTEWRLLEELRDRGRKEARGVARRALQGPGPALERRPARRVPLTFRRGVHESRQDRRAGRDRGRRRRVLRLRPEAVLLARVLPGQQRAAIEAYCAGAPAADRARSSSPSTSR